MNDFIKFLEAGNLSASTQKYYILHVNKFLQWHDNDVINTEKKDILKYLEHLKKNKKQQNITRKNSLIALNHYFTFLMQNEIITSNPTSFLKIRGTKKKQLYKIFTADELRRLVDDFYNNFIKNFDENHIPKNQRRQSFLSRNRNYCMLTFLIYQGLHTNELQRITLDDIDLIKASVKIRASKKTAERKLNLKAEQIGVLMHYLQNIREQILEFHKDENNNLFLMMPKSGRSTTAGKNIMNIIKPMSRQVKSINENFINFMQIRASVITLWIKTYGLRKTQYMAGHKYIHSTETYLSNDLESLTDDITKFNPF